VFLLYATTIFTLIVVMTTITRQQFAPIRGWMQAPLMNSAPVQDPM